MNRYFLPGLALLLFFVLTSCGNSPQSVAKNFTENLAKGKISEAKKYATEPTGEMLDFASKIGAMPVNTDFTFIYVDKTVEGDQATVRYKESPDGHEETIKLVRIDGEWKVHMQPGK
ncbi:MAG: DUF4878 domain-containing protein [Chlorobium sp.]|nr:DUF4878 domain-containing protein [Chlorobium sp.]MCW8814416.1 DUF4878 domain-containing protein [Chlorobium sp.]MCW8819557.1 DUF4878 domain-containing protein [Ignavibacteriaceae bacterium]